MPQQSFYIAHHVNHIARFLQAVHWPIRVVNLKMQQVVGVS